MGYFGIDGTTNPGIGRMTTSFYIGELGYGTCLDCGPCGNRACFNTNAARAAGPSYTYGYWGLQEGLLGPEPRRPGGPSYTYEYWGLQGPTQRPSNLTPYAWGQQQAQAAYQAWYDGPYASYVYGTTLFADVEERFGGWLTDGSSSSRSQNAAVLNGFIDYIYSVSLRPGVYIRQDLIANWFGSSFTASHPFVYWATGNVQGVCACRCATNNCAPCDTSCNTLSPVESNWNTTVRHACFASQGIFVWQFWIDSCGCAGDFDCAVDRAFYQIGCS